MERWRDYPPPCLSSSCFSASETQRRAGGVQADGRRTAVKAPPPSCGGEDCDACAEEMKASEMDEGLTAES